MRRTNIFVAFMIFLAFAGALSVLAGQTPGAGLEQQLRSQYRPASVAANGAVVRAGSQLVVATDGIKANPLSDGVYWYNSHKPGGPIKYSMVFESLSGNLAPQVRTLQVGEKVILTRLEVKASDVEFYIQTSVDNSGDAPFRALVLFQFQKKGYVNPANLKAIQDSISEVLTPDTSSPETGAASPPSEAQTAPPRQRDQPNSLAGSYFMPKTGSHLQLNEDGSFAMQASNGVVSPGHFTVSGDTLALTYTATGRSSLYRIQGDQMYSNTGAAWIRQGGTPAPAASSVTLPSASLNLPATYVSAQTPTDQLQLNSNNTFSLQEGGQAYHGNFVLNGNSLELAISESNTKTTATLQGSNLTDSSGQIWTLREQTAGISTSGTVLKNEDIVKMAKAGFDDGLVIAKINGSKCKFDTSPDALIGLKQSGVSAAVIKAMVGAGK
jgi:hypothetical protein